MFNFERLPVVAFNQQIFAIAILFIDECSTSLKISTLWVKI